MKIDLSKKQFKEMLLASMFYSWIRGGLADSKGEDFKRYEELNDYLLQIAKKENMNEFFEDYHSSILPSDELANEVDETMDEYNEDNFWHELITALGKRDFFRDITDEEEKEIAKDGWLPEKVHKYYEKYEDEFDKYGIERMEIKEIEA